MYGKRRIFAALLITSVVFLQSSASVVASSSVLKKEAKGSAVTELQKNLKKLGYMSVAPTGYYGDATVAAVKKLQKEHGYQADGIAGSSTNSLIGRLLGKNIASRSADSTSSSASGTLKKGMKSSAVTALQKNLVKIGYLSTQPTGYYGDATVSAVKKLQKKYGYAADGVAGSKTLLLVQKLANGSSVKAASKTTSAKTAASPTASRGTTQTSYMLPWFSSVSKLFARGETATVYDIDSGLSFKVKRTYGSNHADSEALTAKDTATMKKIFGGSWNWSRRAVIISVDGKKIAASIAGMPHAGTDKYAANKYISSRSGGYGSGVNLDSVKGNNMNGHFDIHFYGSRTHGTNRVDSAHQRMVKKAAEWAKKNL